MSNYSKIYWLTRLDNIRCALFWVIGISAIIVGGYVIAKFVALVEDDDEISEQISKKKYAIKLAFFVLIASILLQVFIPSKNDMIMIYTGGKTMGFVQSDTAINKIPAQTTKIISDYLDKTIKDLDNKK